MESPKRNKVYHTITATICKHCNAGRLCLFPLFTDEKMTIAHCPFFNADAAAPSIAYVDGLAPLQTVAIPITKNELSKFMATSVQ